jgi:hypothetical protein
MRGNDYNINRESYVVNQDSCIVNLPSFLNRRHNGKRQEVFKR